MDLVAKPFSSSHHLAYPVGQLWASSVRSTNDQPYLHSNFLTFHTKIVGAVSGLALLAAISFFLIRRWRRGSRSFRRLPEFAPSTQSGLSSMQSSRRNTMSERSVTANIDVESANATWPFPTTDTFIAHEDRYTTPAGPSRPPRAYQREQAEESLAPEPVVTNCPIQRLQNRLRQHNSTDPRPKRKTILSRTSIATATSRYSGSECSSPSRSSRFSFGLLKFMDVRGSLGGRGSGWSLWFRQDDGPKEKASQGSSQEKFGPGNK